jgi:hypothetical protein
MYLNQTQPELDDSVAFSVFPTQAYLNRCESAQSRSIGAWRILVPESFVGAR